MYARVVFAARTDNVAANCRRVQAVVGAASIELVAEHLMST